MGDLMSSYGFWMIFGLLLLLSEWVLPGLVALFFGIGALLVGILTWTGLIETLPAQLILFAVLSVASLFTLRRRFYRWMHGTESDRGNGEYSDNGLAGRRVIVTRDFADGLGTVELNGTNWHAESDEPLKTGEHAWVVRNAGILLVVSANRPMI